MAGVEVVAAFIAGGISGIAAAAVKYLRYVRRYEDTIWILLQNYADDRQIDKAECEEILEQLKKDLCGRM